METSTGISMFLGSWALLYLIDVYLKSHLRHSQRYIEFLADTGLYASPFQVRWFTTRFNRFFLRFGQSNSSILQCWFNLGVWCCLLAMCCSVCMLLWLIYQALQPTAVRQEILTPVLPGVNLPTNQLGYYLLTLLVCGIFHEMGHAVSAVREKVHVNGFGLFILAIYPGAYVDMSTEHLNGVTPIQQLRIFCAGVWHNFIIVCVAIVSLLSIPTVANVFYQTGGGAVVYDISENSAVSGPQGLYLGSVVTSIDDCLISSAADWKACLAAALQKESQGFCLSPQFINSKNISSEVFQTSSGSSDCCHQNTSTHLCFMYHSKSPSSASTQACLPARSTTDHPPCTGDQDCRGASLEGTRCFHPSLDEETKLLLIHRKKGQTVIFLGHPLDLYYTVFVSSYVPRASFIPRHIPDMLILLCKYFISLSGALAVLNVVPCYALDGQWILAAFMDLFLKSWIPDSNKRHLVFSAAIFMGTLLLGINILLAMWSLFR